MTRIRPSSGLRNAAFDFVDEETAPASDFRARIRRQDAPASAQAGDDEALAAAFRNRLQGLDASSSAQPAQTTVASDLDSRHKDLYRQFGAYSPDASPDVFAAIKNPREDRIDATVHLRETLAEAGTQLHASAMDKLVQHHKEIEAKIDEFADDAIPLLGRLDSLYNKIEHPLAATVCHSDTNPRDTIAAHLARIRRELEEADKELRRLAAEHAECVRFEENMLRKLSANGGDHSGDSAEETRAMQRKTEAFKQQAESISQETARLLEDTETEHKKKVQSENMKMLQGLQFMMAE